jgi:putative endonuclease
MKRYHVYILASRSRRVYVGVTGNLRVRIREHRTDQCAHTRRYRINRLVYVEQFATANEAIRVKKIIKGWRRSKKLALISTQNPAWEDYFPQ